MKIAIAQINATAGDLAGNCAKIIDYARRAEAAGASLLLCPELVLSGYSPEDLLLRNDFNLSCERALQALALALPPQLTVVVGHPRKHLGNCYNAASVIEGGKVSHTYHKELLPNDSVFDEVRYFSEGSEALVIEHQGHKLGIVICADVWGPEPARRARDAGAKLLLVLNASPYHIDKQKERYEVVRDRIKETGLPVIYANLVGGQDELVFDGASFVMNDEGALTQQLPSFAEALGIVTFSNGAPEPAQISLVPELEPAVYQALSLGLRDYVLKNNFPGVLLGLSGGIDSALTLAVAVDALGADRVQAVMMPSEFTAPISLDDARTMAANLNIRYSEMEIDTLFEAFCATLAPAFAGKPFDTAEENLQARIRGTLLMALSNKFGGIVLTTGNKSEIAVGYSTLYGDMAGGFSLLKDVSKTLVYQLANYRNTISRVIPERIILRPPSAELRHGQTDQDSLPDYAVLDAIMEAYVEHDYGWEEIIGLGYREQDVIRVTRLIDRNEYKRRQAPVGVRVTQRGFGKDRRYPLTNKYVFNE
ncbi:NAD+ synthase [Methylobacillus arboreus]|uniref:NAD+ synthase n=1 Tax=Methylobacillus arboreus TaxID=755170 RepID=UPI001E489BF7|nr:NAD+ synthase [Methylobacillus arboreus]MCB5189378.1 NAD+ synthase [Methylobacillus arboreus]